MVLTDLKEWRRLEQARLQPGFSFVRFRLDGVLRGVREEMFPKLTMPLCAWFVSRGSPACICPLRTRADIYLHQVLNHPQTPKLVRAHIFAHELVHLEIPPREVDGEEIQHPPEFWQRERAVSPQRELAWEWIWANFWADLNRRRWLERIGVASGWKGYLGRHLLSVEDVVKCNGDDRPKAPSAEAGW